MKIHLIKVLLDALEDERKAEATYAAILDKFGPVRPFTNIIEAERRHARAIERQMTRLGFPIPKNHWEGKGEAPASLTAACEAGVQGEIENIALYDRLIPQIEDPEVRRVLRNLQEASRENHLPAFRRCLDRESGGGGRGRRRRGHGRGCGSGGRGWRHGRSSEPMHSA